MLAYMESGGVHESTTLTPVAACPTSGPASCPICPVCGKKLSSKAALTGHLRTHTGELFAEPEHYLENVSPIGRSCKRRICRSCYKTICEEYGREYARRRTPKVLTICKMCPGSPFMCAKCFQEHHILPDQMKSVVLGRPKLN